MLNESDIIALKFSLPLLFEHALQPVGLACGYQAFLRPSTRRLETLL